MLWKQAPRLQPKDRAAMQPCARAARCEANENGSGHAPARKERAMGNLPFERNRYNPVRDTTPRKPNATSAARPNRTPPRTTANPGATCPRRRGQDSGRKRRVIGLPVPEGILCRDDGIEPRRCLNLCFTVSRATLPQ